MRLESARALKQEMMERVVVPLAVASEARVRRRAIAVLEERLEPDSISAVGHADVAVAESVGISAAAVDELQPQQRSIALGVTSTRKGDYRLAVRVQRQALLFSPHLAAIREHAGKELDVRFVGRLVKRAISKRPTAASPAGLGTPPWYRSRSRPLQPGVSIAHWKVTAGTLGCFVKRSNGQVAILSNNHVLADEDAAQAGDDVIQPGAFDHGTKKDRVGELLPGWVKLKRKSPNLVDAALASIDDGVETNLSSLQGLIGLQQATLSGVFSADELDEGIDVHKVGRTTGPTSGRITAFELDNVVVNYRVGNLRFDSQIEIEGVGDAPFSDGGDSGSLIVDGQMRGLGLLFAGGDTGGTNGLGLTYANLIRKVLEKLKVDLVY